MVVASLSRLPVSFHLMSRSETKTSLESMSFRNIAERNLNLNLRLIQLISCLAQLDIQLAQGPTLQQTSMMPLDK
jgi:hypothetical protein